MVFGSGIPCIFLIDIADLRVFRRHHFARTIGGAVIHHNDLAVGVGLGKERVQTQAQKILPVISGNTDADQGEIILFFHAKLLMNL